MSNEQFYFDVLTKELGKKLKGVDPFINWLTLDKTKKLLASINENNSFDLDIKKLIDSKFLPKEFETLLGDNDIAELRSHYRGIVEGYLAKEKKLAEALEKETELESNLLVGDLYNLVERQIRLADMGSVQTGFPQLDKQLIMKAGTTTIFHGRSGTLKSTLVNQIVYNILNLTKHPVIHLTWEGVSEDTELKLINLVSIRTGHGIFITELFEKSHHDKHKFIEKGGNLIPNLNNPSQKEKYRDVVKVFDSWNKEKRLAMRHAIFLEDIEKEIIIPFKKIQERTGNKKAIVLSLDYLQRMTTTNGSMKRDWTRIQYFSDYIDNLASKHGLIVIMAAQQNKDGDIGEGEGALQSAANSVAMTNENKILAETNRKANLGVGCKLKNTTVGLALMAELNGHQVVRLNVEKTRFKPQPNEEEADIFVTSSDGIAINEHSEISAYDTTAYNEVAYDRDIKEIELFTGDEKGLADLMTKINRTCSNEYKEKLSKAGDMKLIAIRSKKNKPVGVTRMF